MSSGKQAKAKAKAAAARAKRTAPATPWSDRSFLTLLVTLALLPFAIAIFPGGTTWATQPQLVMRVFVLILGATGAFAFWVVALVTGEATVRRTPALIALGIYLVLIVISGCTAVEPARAFFGSYDDPLGVLTYGALAVVFFLTLQLVVGQKRLIGLSRALVYPAALVALLAWIERLAGYGLFYGTTIAAAGQNGYLITRGIATFGNPDFLGHYLVIPALLALALTACAATTRERTLRVAAFVLIASACMGTLTRGALLGLIAGLLVFGGYAIAKGYRWKGLALLAALTLVASFLIAIPLGARSQDQVLVRFFGGTAKAKVVAEKTDSDRVQNAIAKAAVNRNTKLGGRLLMWGDLPKMVAASPLTGTGPCNYAGEWQKVRSKATLLYGSEAVMTDAHNLPLQIVATLGIPALLAALVLASLALASGFRLQSRAPHCEDGNPAPGRALYLGWLAAMSGALVGSLTAMSTLTWRALLFVGLAVLLAPTAKDTSDSAEETGTVRALGPALIGIGSLFLAAGLYWSFTWLPANIEARTIQSGKATDVLASMAHVQKTAPYDYEIKDGIGQIWLTEAQSKQASDATYLPLVNRALAQYRTFAAVAPRSAAAQTGLAVAYFMRYDATHAATDLKAGLNAADATFTLKPGAVSLRYIVAQTLENAGNNAAARAYLTGWTGYDPTNTAADVYYKKLLSE